MWVEHADLWWFYNTLELKIVLRVNGYSKETNIILIAFLKERKKNINEKWAKQTEVKHKISTIDLAYQL